jgi:hypothetical protein
MQWLYEQEFKTMTYQVGLVGADGFVLASDQMLKQFEGTELHRGLISKFLSAPGVTCCWSGDSVAEHAANAVHRLDWAAIPREKEEIRRALIEAGDGEYRRMAKLAGPLFVIPRKVLVAAHNETLWLLEVGERSIANQRLDRVIAGDTENTARHFIKQYAEGCYLRPVDDLIFLAGYTILAAADENPCGVGGLEIAVFRPGREPRFLSREAIADIELRSRNLTGIVGRALVPGWTP